jgi:hypothetical protein
VGACRASGLVQHCFWTSAAFCSPPADHLARKRTAKHFNLEWAEMDERHRLNFETHEEGKL